MQAEAQTRRMPVCGNAGAGLSGGGFRCGNPQVWRPGGADAASCRVCSDAGIFCNREPIAFAKRVTRTRDPEMRSRPWNFLKSMADFLADGCQTLSPEDYRARLMVCTHCAERTDNTCAICGCYLALKARGRAFKCPLGKWPPPGSRSADATPPPDCPGAARPPAAPSENEP